MGEVIRFEAGLVSVLGRKVTVSVLDGHLNLGRLRWKSKEILISSWQL